MGKFKEIDTTRYENKNAELEQISFIGLIEIIKSFRTPAISVHDQLEIDGSISEPAADFVSENQLTLGVA